MDDAFLRERAEHIRNLVEKADPHIKRRLLDLAAKRGSGKTPQEVPPNIP
jgi:hypothetical protein